MNQILKFFYDMDITNIDDGYFNYNNQYFYICFISQVEEFMSLYQTYLLFMKSMNLKGYQIVRNKYNQIWSEQYLVFTYVQEYYSLDFYITHLLNVNVYHRLSLCDIKEAWISEIDMVRSYVCKYAISYNYDNNIMALIYYYTFLNETGINILNIALNIDKYAYVDMYLTLKDESLNNYYQLLNPLSFTIGSRIKTLYVLNKNSFIDDSLFEDYLYHHIFSIYEIYYLYARLFYHHHFYQDIINERLDLEKTIQYRNMTYSTIEIIQKYYEILSLFLALPKISWIK